jgi:hypothetical protein
MMRMRMLDMMHYCYTKNIQSQRLLHLSIRGKSLYDEDENVRYDALLLYQKHPKSKVITPLNKR